MNVDITIPAQSVTVPSQDVPVTIPAAQIVYQNAWLNQTSAITESDVFTPSGQGVFRVTAASFAYGSGHCGAGGGIYYPGPGGLAFNSDFNAGNSPQQQNTPASYVFGGTSGVALQIYTSTFGSLNYYDLYVTIEQLQ